MKINETNFFKSLEKTVGTEWAKRILLRVLNCKYGDPTENNALLKNINAEEFNTQLANGAHDNAIINAVSEYINKTLPSRRHRIICAAVGFNYPAHELVSDEKKALAACRKHWQELEAKKAKLIDNRDVFGVLATKRALQINRLDECVSAIKSLDDVKVAKNNPAREFMAKQMQACEAEIKALTNEIAQCYDNYISFNLDSYIPEEIVKEMDEKEMKEMKEENN